jgi:toxin ParE1/3/4
VHRLSPGAQADLDAIWDYVFAVSGSEKLADAQIHSITRRFYLLSAYPRIGRARDDDLGRGRRSYPVDRYVIVYRVKGEDVRILRVAHSARDIKALMDGGQ